MFGIELTDYDRKVYTEELDGFLPERFIDVHLHLWKPGMRKTGQKGCVTWTSLVAPSQTYEDMEASYSALFPNKKVAKVLIGSPSCELAAVNAYIRECADSHGCASLYCTNWDSGREEIKAALASGFSGIKPYQNNSPSYIPAPELRIFDFLTHEQLDLMNETGGIVMLHIPRALRLKDPVNLAQMLEIDERYPNARVIIAHVGRAYIDGDIGNAFDILRHTKNLRFDFSANTCEKAMRDCIEAVGTERVMFGSDMPFTKMRMYRTERNGSYVNVVPRGLYGDISGDKNMAETDSNEITTFMYEELRAFKLAARSLGLTAAEISEMMYGNASRLFGITL